MCRYSNWYLSKTTGLNSFSKCPWRKTSFLKSGLVLTSVKFDYRIRMVFVRKVKKCHTYLFNWLTRLAFLRKKSSWFLLSTSQWKASFLWRTISFGNVIFLVFDSCFKWSWKWWWLLVLIRLVNSTLGFPDFRFTSDLKIIKFCYTWLTLVFNLIFLYNCRLVFLVKASKKDHLCREGLEGKRIDFDSSIKNRIGWNVLKCYTIVSSG